MTKEEITIFYENNANVSRLMIPFYLDHEFERKHKALFNTQKWDRIVREPVYPAKYIGEIYSNESDEICALYSLNKDKWSDFDLPDDTDNIQLESRILSGRTYNHAFRLVDITAAYFTTGIGFLMLDVRHDDDASLEEIVNTCFALSDIFSAEHDVRESRMDFVYSKENEVKRFSMKNAVYAILMAEQLEGKLDIFPTSTRRKLNAYHRIFRPNREENDDRMVHFLTRGLHGNAILQKEKYDFTRSDFQFSSSENTMWSIGSYNAVSISYDDEQNHTFLAAIHPRHVDMDYFLIYLFAAHKRELLLKYSYEAVQNWNKPRRLTLMRDKLVEFNIWSSYNTVSVETAYQNFYECTSHAMRLEKLENDVQDVIVQVNESVNAAKERRINAILSSIAVLAVFSVLCDALGAVDRLYDPAPLRAGHYIVIALIIAVICFGVFWFFHRKK